MRNLKRYLGLAWPVACAVALILGGCAPGETDPLAADERRELVVECNDLKRRVQRQEADIERLESEKTILQQTVEDLRRREQILAGRLVNLQKETQRQKEIIEILNDLPEERKTLEREVLTLKRRIVELEIELREASGHEGEPQPPENAGE